MKFFAFDAALDEQLKLVQRRIRKLMNGAIAAQLRAAGMDYAKLYGVSLVHLRQFSQELKPGKDLADRLWHRNIRDRKSTRLNSSHVRISYAVFCLKKKKVGTGI